MRVNGEPVDLCMRLGPLGEAFFVAPLEDADQDGEVEECTGAPVPAHNTAKLATGDSKPYNRLACRLRHLVRAMAH